MVYERVVASEDPATAKLGSHDTQISTDVSPFTSSSEKASVILSEQETYSTLRHVKRSRGHMRKQFVCR